MVPADYAFVLHTAHPVTGAAGELFGEVVVGMGEALVGNYAGRCVRGNNLPLHMFCLEKKGAFSGNNRRDGPATQNADRHGHWRVPGNMEEYA